jgi:hypothetical protein
MPKIKRIDLVLFLLIGFVLFLAGCAGNGQGLDENGNPIGSGNGGEPPVAFDPTFTNIQNNILTPNCTPCHFGTNAPQGLRLEETQSFGVLVGVRSIERPELFRVEPGNPDNSYLIRKLEGGPGISGAQMPLNGPPLDQLRINAVRVWISRGALNN